MAIFVFMHVGDHLNIIPKIFIASIYRTHKNPTIIQCSDKESEIIPGATKIARFGFDKTNLMTFRLKAYAALKLQEPAIYCDSDMGIMREIDPIQILDNYQLAICNREYNCEGLYGQVEFRGKVYNEHRGKTWYEAYPYLACFNITEDYLFWHECYENLRSIDEKWHFWLGDQEAMRNVLQNGSYKYTLLPESEFARLPDENIKINEDPYVIHFKGRNRKKMMLDWAKDVGIIQNTPT